MVAQALHESVENGSGTGLHQVLEELTTTMSHGTDTESEADPVGRATLLCRTVEQQCEGSDERLAQLMRECVLAVSYSSENIHGQPGAEPDDNERLRAFAAKQQSMRKKYGSMRGRLSGENE